MSVTDKVSNQLFRRDQLQHEDDEDELCLGSKGGFRSQETYG